MTVDADRQGIWGQVSQQINQAYQRILASDVRYRFVIVVSWALC